MKLLKTLILSLFIPSYDSKDISAASVSIDDTKSRRLIILQGPDDSPHAEQLLNDMQTAFYNQKVADIEVIGNPRWGVGSKEILIAKIEDIAQYNVPTTVIISAHGIYERELGHRTQLAEDFRPNTGYLLSIFSKKLPQVDYLLLSCESGGALELDFDFAKYFHEGTIVALTTASKLLYTREIHRFILHLKETKKMNYISAENILNFILAYARPFLDISPFIANKNGIRSLALGYRSLLKNPINIEERIKIHAKFDHMIGSYYIDHLLCELDKDRISYGGYPLRKLMDRELECDVAVCSDSEIIEIKKESIKKYIDYGPTLLLSSALERGLIRYEDYKPLESYSMSDLDVCFASAPEYTHDVSVKCCL